MTLNGTFTFSGSRQDVWQLLQDPVVLARALPGTERLVLASPDRYEGRMKASIGPITAATFDVTVTLSDKTPPERMGMQIDGKGSVGYLRGAAVIELQEQGEGATLMQYTSNVQVGGRIAAVGQRLLDSVARMMARQALQALQRELQARMASKSEA
jgi:carbon monoxide dehydrogenase subunit G